MYQRANRQSRSASRLIARSLTSHRRHDGVHSFISVRSGVGTPRMPAARVVRRCVVQRPDVFHRPTPRNATKKTATPTPVMVCAVSSPSANQASCQHRRSHYFEHAPRTDISSRRWPSAAARYFYFEASWPRSSSLYNVIERASRSGRCPSCTRSAMLRTCRFSVKGPPTSVDPRHAVHASSIRAVEVAARVRFLDGGKLGCAVDGRCWIVDPLDGTTNFLHGSPIRLSVRSSASRAHPRMTTIRSR